jgi:biopolymer transport protein ExbB
MSLVAHLLSLSGGLLAVLALLLLLSLAVVIERGWFYLHVVRNGTNITAEITTGASRASLIDIKNAYRDMPQGLVALTALDYLDTGPATLEAALEHRITEILPSLDRNLWLLDATVTLAPLFGLLGTIVGMVQTFNLLGNGPGMVSGHATGGIADALVATGGGLFVAIVAVIGLSVFNNRLRETVRQLDAIKLAGLAIAHGSPAATEIRSESIHRPVVGVKEALS